MMQSRSSLPTSRIVFLLHGIKTRGKWQKDVGPLLNQAGFTVASLDYGYFLALQLLSGPARRKKVDWFRDEYMRQRDRLKCERPSIIAHSLGTYLVAQALEKYPEILVDRFVLCGAIVRRQFPWQMLARRGQVGLVLNQFGGRDFWARIVEWVVPDAGQSGLVGFEPSDAIVQCSNPNFGHGDYFYDLNYTSNWIPFLLGEPLSGEQRLKPLHYVNWKFRFAVTMLALLTLTPIVYLVSHRRTPRFSVLVRPDIDLIRFLENVEVQLSIIIQGRPCADHVPYTPTAFWIGARSNTNPPRELLSAWAKELSSDQTVFFDRWKNPGRLAGTCSAVDLHPNDMVQVIVYTRDGQEYASKSFPVKVATPWPQVVELHNPSSEESHGPR
jgi:pimeloyl-ACP methyl ester carboxylesterase